jgi:two-component system nitrate/nitrite response regulator NarL
MAGPYSVVLADSQRLFLDALGAALTRAGYRVVGRCTDLHALHDCVRERTPDLCVIDSWFPDGNGAVAVAALTAVDPALKVLLLSDDARPTTIEQALHAGACGFVHKSRGLSAVLNALHDVAAGRSLEQRLRAPARPAAVGSVPPAARLADHLTARERETLGLIADGLCTAEMAHRLGVSSATVRSHVQAVLVKLGVHSRVEAASVALRYGIVEPTPALPPAALGTEHVP